MNFTRDKNIEIYSIHNGEKFVVAERFIRTLKTKFRSTPIWKYVYIDQLDGIVNEYNNLKPVEVNSIIYTYILTLVNQIVKNIINLKFVII